MLNIKIFLGIAVTAVAVNLSNASGSDLFLFDHSFRKTGADSNTDKLMKRIGVAFGEDDSDTIADTKSHHFMRRSGEADKDNEEDQIAVESSLFSFSKIPSSKFKLTPDFEKVDKSNKDQKQKKYYQIERMSVLDEELNLDVSQIPMEHRNGGQGLFSPMSRSMEKARQMLLSSMNVVLTPESVSTYLAQMWITNIMQTVGWGLIAALQAKTSGRAFSSNRISKRKSEFEGRDDIEEEEDDEYGDEGMFDSLDSKAVATILRGLADAADNWGHNEL